MQIVKADTKQAAGITICVLKVEFIERYSFLVANHKASLYVRSTYIGNVVWAPQTKISPSRYCMMCQQT